jgi:dephospho-CoA kinase
MALLIAVAGHSGAGKTTAVRYLNEICGGEVVYLGAAILCMIQERRLPETRESERILRLEVRQQHGPAALAMLEADRVERLLKAGSPVIIDAVFSPAELNLLRARAPENSIFLLGILASFSTRSQRLARRSCRPLTANEVAMRDRTELETLGTGEVLANATHKLTNEGSLHDFQNALATIARQVTSA